MYCIDASVLTNSEISSAIARGTDDTEKALDFVKELKQIPNIVFVPIDRELADEAMRLAAEYRLRGCDAIYVAVASMFGTKLISLDKQQIERAADCIEVGTPEDELKNL